MDNNFRLRVYDGNSRFGGNVQVTGSIDVASVDIANTLTIAGKGSVRSNGPSPLRIGFTEDFVNVVLNNNESVSVLADIADFSGGNDDVRVFVAQVVPDLGGSVSWQKVGITVMGVDAANNTCLLWLHNRSGAGGVLKGTIYLTTIAKN